MGNLLALRAESSVEDIIPPPDDSVGSGITHEQQDTNQSMQVIGESLHTAIFGFHSLRRRLSVIDIGDQDTPPSSTLPPAVYHRS